MDNFVIRKNQKPQASLPVINVYTDGACTNNGKPDARAGFEFGLEKVILEILVNLLQVLKQIIEQNYWLLLKL